MALEDGRKCMRCEWRNAEEESGERDVKSGHQLGTEQEENDETIKALVNKISVMDFLKEERIAGKTNMGFLFFYLKKIITW